MGTSGFGLDDGQCLPRLSQPAAHNRCRSCSLGLNVALETVTNYFRFFHTSFFSSAGEPGEVERTGMAPDLLRIPKP